MKTVAIVSGGMDSTTLLYQLGAENHEIVAVLGFDYGQRHAKELQYATEVCEANGLQYKVIDLSNLRDFLGTSSQTSDSIEVPEGHYAEDSMKLTVVPNRNMIMLSIAAGHAMALKADTIAYAAHGGDHAIYPDCRPEFVSALDRAISIADWNKVNIYAPFLSLTKADICKIGNELGVPFEMTWSCYKGLDKHCGRCGTCTERREAFQLAGVIDPTEYENEGNPS